MTAIFVDLQADTPEPMTLEVFVEAERPGYTLVGNETIVPDLHVASIVRDIASLDFAVLYSLLEAANLNYMERQESVLWMNRASEGSRVPRASAGHGDCLPGWQRAAKPLNYKYLDTVMM